MNGLLRSALAGLNVPGSAIQMVTEAVGKQPEAIA
jgi:hypothetical protein